MPGAYKVVSDDIFANMATLAAAPIATISDLAETATESGRQIKMLEITGPGDSSTRDVALIIGGQHAREWAPPDAVFSFAKNLVDAYGAGSDLSYPATTIRSGGRSVGYSAWTIPIADVRRIVDNLVILVLPVANPDGRDHSLARAAAGDTSGMRWRGNRNVAACSTHGVDLNRNYDIGWDPNVLPAGDRAYYATADLAQIVTDGGFDPDCTSDAYHGPDAGSEKEVQNIQTVIDARKVNYFIDVHSSGRWILCPWGIAGTQTNDSTKSFLTTALDRTTAGGAGRTVTDGTYEEFIPDSRPLRIFETHRQIATAIKRAIEEQAGPSGSTARSRSGYRIEPIVNIYKILRNLPRLVPVPGSATDYAFARQFRPGETKPAFSFALECGSRRDGERGWFPTTTVYEKVEREVHAALCAMLKAAVGAPPPAGSGGADGSICPMVIATLGTSAFGRVERIREIRDFELSSAPFARWLRHVDRRYRRISPPLARYIGGARWRKALTRYLVIHPVYVVATGLNHVGRLLRSERIGRWLPIWTLLVLVAVAQGIWAVGHA